MPKSEREKRVESSGARETGYVLRKSGAVEKWDIESETRDSVRLTSFEKGQKVIKDLPRKLFDRLNAAGVRGAMDILDEMKSDEARKAVSFETGHPEENERLEEIRERMREAAEGDYEGVRALLAREALMAAKVNAGLDVRRISELRGKIDEVKEKIERQIKEKEQRLEQIGEWIATARKEGNLARVAGLELKGVEAYADLKSLKERLENNFGKVLRLLGVIDALDRVGGIKKSRQAPRVGIEPTTK